MAAVLESDSQPPKAKVAPANGSARVGLKISELIAGAAENAALTKPLIAFEYYPPKTENGVKTLVSKRLPSMALQRPLYIDMTWGAGGSTSDLTLDLCRQAKDLYGLETNMHLTCTNMEVEKITKGLAGAKAAGIRNIVALRGDPPAGEEKWQAVEGGFTCALDLVTHIRKEHGDYFCLSVAGYPEGHPTVIKDVAPGQQLTPAEQKRVVYSTGEDGAEKLQVCFDDDYANEIAYLKKKVDAGADLIITQMFFDVEVLLQFVRDCRAVGIAVPIIPGIMMISTYAGFKRMLGFCKTRVPPAIAAEIEALKDDKKGLTEYGIEFARTTSEALNAAGIEVLHFYTLNHEGPVKSVLHALGRDLVAVPGKTTWPELVGRAGKAAVSTIKAERPDLQSVTSMEEGSMMTMDFREDRVRVMVNVDGNVTKAPTVG